MEDRFDPANILIPSTIRTQGGLDMIRPTALAGLLAVLQGLAPAHAQESRTLDRYQIDFNGLQAPVDATWLTGMGGPCAQDPGHLIK